MAPFCGKVFVSALEHSRALRIPYLLLVAWQSVAWRSCFRFRPTFSPTPARANGLLREDIGSVSLKTTVFFIGCPWRRGADTDCRCERRGTDCDAMEG